MKLGDYAKKVDKSYKTAWRWYQKGQINGYQAPSGTIIVTECDDKAMPQKVAIYSRVSSSENRPNLQSQAERLPNACPMLASQKDGKSIKSSKKLGLGSTIIANLRRAMRTTEKITQKLRPCN